MNITVMGSGVFGFAIALKILQNGHNVTLWTSNKEKEEELKKDKQIIGGIKIPKNMKITSSYEKAIKNADIIFLMTSAKHIASVCQNIKPYYNKKQIFCIGSKGIEQGTSKFVHEVFKDNLKSSNYSVLSGPSFAIDLASNDPIAFSLASSNSKTDKMVKKALASDTVKLRTSKDMIGTELCGSIKNVIAIAAGIITGLGYNESTRSFLLVESMHDIKELIKGLGGRKKSILSYAGIGDLILTCTSTKSRNYSYGILLGQKDYVKAKKYTEENTVEGYYTLKSIYALLHKKKIKMPIIDLIYRIVMKNENPEILVNFLINKK